MKSFILYIYILTLLVCAARAGEQVSGAVYCGTKLAGTFDLIVLPESEYTPVLEQKYAEYTSAVEKYNAAEEACDTAKKAVRKDRTLSSAELKKRLKAVELSYASRLQRGKQAVKNSKEVFITTYTSVLAAAAKDNVIKVVGGKFTTTLSGTYIFLAATPQMGDYLYLKGTIENGMKLKTNYSF